jgi:hypothetical protein
MNCFMNYNVCTQSIIIILVVLGFEFGVFHLLGRHSTT